MLSSDKRSQLSGIEQDLVWSANDTHMRYYSKGSVIGLINPELYGYYTIDGDTLTVTKNGEKIIYHRITW